MAAPAAVASNPEKPLPVGVLLARSKPNDVKKPGNVPGPRAGWLLTNLSMSPSNLSVVFSALSYGSSEAGCQYIPGPSTKPLLGVSNPDVIPVPAEPPLLNIGLFKILFIIISFLFYPNIILQVLYRYLKLIVMVLG